jgi:hypothetical protein
MTPDENQPKTESTEVSNIFNLNKSIDSEFENAVLHYLVDTIKSGNFDVKDLSFNGLIKKFNITNDLDKGRLKNVLENLETDRISKKKSGIEIYIPIEVQKNHNIISIKPISIYYPLTQYLVGLIALIILTSASSYLSNFIIEFFNTGLIFALIILSASFGFFLPIFIGIVLFKIYNYILSIYPNLDRKFILIFISSEAFAFIFYISLTILLNETKTSTGFIEAFVAGLALPGIFILFQKKKEKQASNMDVK